MGPPARFRRGGKARHSTKLVVAAVLLAGTLWQRLIACFSFASPSHGARISLLQTSGRSSLKNRPLVLRFAEAAPPPGGAGVTGPYVDVEGQVPSWLGDWVGGVGPVDFFKQKPGGEQAQLEEAARFVQGIFPAIPEWADKLLYAFLIVFPFVVFGSWGYMTYNYWRDSQVDLEEYEKRKVRKALKLDPNLGLSAADAAVVKSREAEFDELRRRGIKQRGATALEESMALDEKMTRGQKRRLRQKKPSF